MAAGADDVLDRPEAEEMGLRLTVAERRSAARESAHTARVVESAFAHAPDAMLVVSLASGTVTHVNAAAAAMLGQTAEALRGVPWQDLVPWTAEGEPPDPGDLLHDAGEGSARLVLRRGDAGLRATVCRAVPLPTGDAGGLLLRLSTSSEGSAPEPPAQARESVHDPLTGLLTGPAFLERLRAAVRAAGRHRHPLSLAVLDIENFRAVNDRHGHLAGDEVLARLSESIRRALRTEDLAGRVHGDTFALAFPFTPAAGAAAAVERLRGEIEGLTFLDPGDGAPFEIRLRLAVVEQSARKVEAEALLESARTRARENVT
jgi:diguanylate cyclase (GGDEF)-like protein